MVLKLLILILCLLVIAVVYGAVLLASEYDDALEELEERKKTEKRLRKNLHTEMEKHKAMEDDGK